MDLTNERHLAARVAALGESADAAAMPELTVLMRSSSALVRRLAASALGKLAGIVPPAEAVATLLPMLRDPHPQCRQYASKALGAFGVHAAPALPDLRDLYRNPTEKNYVKRSILAAGKTIRESLRIAERQTVRVCQHCAAAVAPDEYARSQRHFQRTYCDRCFDETFAKRRNFDVTVENHKTVRAADGTFVQSQGERRIAEWLTARGLAYRYDERFRILDGYALRPDFYLPGPDLYIEYWGMDTADYKIGMLKKQQIYQQTGKRLVSVHRADLPRIESALAERLAPFIHLPRAGDTVKCPPDAQQVHQQETPA
jgi:hypothetical protein